MRCKKCMAEIGDLQVCPQCGYVQENNTENKQYLTSGTIINEKYEVGTVIGAGGFGVTYSGWDKSLECKVAIKEYFPSSLSTRIPGQTLITAFSGEKLQIFNHGKERFREEAMILMRFAGEEGIVSVYDIIEANGTVYMVMEYVDGITLKQNIEQFGVMSEKNLLDCIIPMLLSLKFVHNAGFIHRDISPDNIMCLPDGSVKLLDFGAARYSVMEESKTLSVIVKQGYTPIEQYQSHGKQGAWTDIYAVGATMYKALTGITPEESLERLAQDSLKRPSQCGADVSDQTESAIMTAMNVRAEDRPQDIDEFLEILTGVKKGNIIQSKKKLNKGIIAAVAVALAVVLSGTGFVLSYFNGIKGKVGIDIDDETVVVPNAINKNIDEAETLFNENQLNMQITGGRIFDAELIRGGYIEENLVITQDPGGGEKVQPESNVRVEISKGKEQKFVPDVTDMLEETALHYIEQAGFDENFEVIIEKEYSTTNMTGTVISQNLPEDSSVDFDGTITFTVSLGNKDTPDAVTTISVEDYTGQNFNELKQELVENGVYLVKSASVYSNEYPYGTVISQSPKAGEEIQSGGAVYVITSLGIEMTRVPDLRYMDVDSAKTALMEKGLSWKIKYVVNDDVDIGLVTEQKTSAGIKTPFGTVIEIYVSAETEGEETADKIEFELEPDSLSIGINESAKLDCTYSGDEKVIWASSNSNIANVDDSGYITAENFGSVTITAAVNGNIALSAVMVTDESIITTVDDYTLTVGDVVSLSSEIPDSILNDVIWRSSYPSVADVDQNGTVTAVGEGYTSITAVYKNHTAECGISVNKKVEYIKILRDTLLGKVSTARQALDSNSIEFEVVEEYSDTIAEGNIIKILYVGHSDNDSFYIAEGSKVTLRGSLGKNTVQSVTVKTPPKKTSYYIGDTLDYSGMILNAAYKDGSSKEIKEGYTVSKSALNELGKQKITVSYEGKSTTFEITVNPIDVSSVSVTPKELSCVVGETKTLSASISPENSTDKTITVSSSDPTVVKVNGLNLTALKPGTATVTVKSSNSKSASCTVTVSFPDAASITLSDNEIFLNGGEKKKLTALVLPENAGDRSVIWSSSDAKVASVDKEGNVAALSSGKAVISAKTVNGKTASCTVNVTVTAESIKITSEATLKIGETYQLKAEITPADASDKTVVYKTSDVNIASVDKNGKITAIKSGTADITASTSNGKISVCKVTVLGDASLKIKTMPQKIEYYIGDALATNGLILTYTDTYGVAHDVKEGYKLLTYDMNKAGQQEIIVTYENLKTSFSINIKTPYVSVSKINTKYGLILAAQTEPTDMPVEWSSSDHRIFYFEGSSIVPVSSGTAYATASMVYNGIEYSDSCPVTIELTEKEENYQFKINYEQYYDGEGWIFGISTNLPNFDLYSVKWSSNAMEYEVEKKTGELYVWYSGETTITVYASYIYNGREYTDSYTVKIDVNKYTLSIFRGTDSTTGERGIYYIDTDIPDFDVYNVQWSLSADGFGGWVNDGCYVVDECSMESGESYTVYASYTYNGKTVTASCTFTLN